MNTHTPHKHDKYKNWTKVGTVATIPYDKAKKLENDFYVQVYHNGVFIRRRRAEKKATVTKMPLKDFAPKRVSNPKPKTKWQKIAKWLRRFLIVLLVWEYLIARSFFNGEPISPVWEGNGVSGGIRLVPLDDYKIVEVETAKAKAESVESLIYKYFGKDAKDALKVAQCESGLRPNAKNRYSTASGVFQIIKGTWISNRRAMGLSTDLGLRFNAEENIKTAKYLFDKRGWSPWVCKP